MSKTRHKVISLTEKDFKWQVFRGSGKGGQKRNKTSNAVRCVHESSGAVGEAEDERSQAQNRKLAFERMTKTKEFQGWLMLQREILRGNVKMEVVEGDAFVEKPIEMTPKGAK